MSTVSIWNDMMQSFLNELSLTFPEEGAIKKYKVSFDLLVSSNPRKCLETFMSEIAPVTELVKNKDEKLFLDCSTKFPLLNELNIEKHWSSASDQTKEAIWQYMNTLLVLGTTITILPADTMNMIEKMAVDCANNMEKDGKGVPQLDQGAIADMVGNLLNLSGK